MSTTAQNKRHRSFFFCSVTVQKIRCSTLERKRKQCFLLNTPSESRMLNLGVQKKTALSFESFSGNRIDRIDLQSYMYIIIMTGKLYQPRHYSLLQEGFKMNKFLAGVTFTLIAESTVALIYITKRMKEEVE